MSGDLSSRNWNLLAWFVDAVEQRKMTIQRVMESIIRHQPKYFHAGDRTLQPMILKDIAE